MSSMIDFSLSIFGTSLMIILMIIGIKYLQGEGRTWIGIYILFGIGLAVYTFYIKNQNIIDGFPCFFLTWFALGIFGLFVRSINP